MAKDQTKQYVYIVQASKEPSWCKIGIANDLEGRLRILNSMIDESEENIYRYIFACEVENMIDVDYDTRVNFSIYSMNTEANVFFLNDELFGMYVEFIKSHPFFIKEIFTLKNIFFKQKAKKKNPSLENDNLQQTTLC